MASKPKTRSATRNRPTSRRSRAAARLDATLARLDALNVALARLARGGAR
jgi:hypothetical protein